MGRWWVADRYEVRPNTEGNRCIVAPYDSSTGRAPPRGETYRPLKSHNHLFLDFARLAERIDGHTPPEVGPEVDNLTVAPSFLPETENNTKVALEWAKKYGVLGLGGERNDPDPCGGEEDTVRAFCEEALWAHRALTLYETVTDPNRVDIDLIASDAEDPYEQETIASDGEYARRYALKQVMLDVEFHVGKYCSPALYRYGDHIVQGWTFHSLLGAMWLQMMWLVISKDAPRRCAWPGCNRIISYVELQQPQEWSDQSIGPWKKNDRRKGYRTRKDKKFCSENCRVKNWQRNRKRTSVG